MIEFLRSAAARDTMPPLRRRCALGGSIPYQDLSHSRLEPERCAQAAGQASIDANQLFQLLDTIAKAVSF